MGIVKEVGSNVKGFKVGDHVGVGPYINSCKHCKFCDDRQENCCENGFVLTFNAIDEDGTITKGGFSTFIVVHQRQVYSVAASLFSFSFERLIVWLFK